MSVESISNDIIKLVTLHEGKLLRMICITAVQLLQVGLLFWFLLILF